MEYARYRATSGAPHALHKPAYSKIFAIFRTALEQLCPKATSARSWPSFGVHRFCSDRRASHHTSGIPKPLPAGEGAPLCCDMLPPPTPPALAPAQLQTAATSAGLLATWQGTQIALLSPTRDEIATTDVTISRKVAQTLLRRAAHAPTSCPGLRSEKRMM